MVLFCRFYSCQLRHGHILRSLEAPFDLLATLVCIFSETAFIFYLLPLPGKTLICLPLHLFYFRFHAAYFPPHLMGHLCCLLFHTSHLTTGDSSHLCRLLLHLCHLLSHIFRGVSPHLGHLPFLLSKHLFCLLADRTPGLFRLIKFCIHLVFHFSDLVSDIKTCLYHSLS